VRSGEGDEALEVAVVLPGWVVPRGVADLMVDIGHEGTFAVLTIGSAAVRHREML
jgi:hypothetical protein